MMTQSITGSLFLIGLMGAGKTTLGKCLAEQLSFSFYDSDAVICAKTGVSIATIFEWEGEQGFRERESSTIAELTQIPQIVLATGGGVPLSPLNRQHLRQRGTVVYLHASPEVLYTRTRYDKSRPLLQVEEPLKKLQALYDFRDPIYRQTAHCVLEVGSLNCAQSAEQLLQLLNRKTNA